MARLIHLILFSPSNM